MADYGTLAEYLLSVEKPEGGKLVRHGGTIIRIPTFPPNFSWTWTVYPRNNAYANIQYGFLISPAIVPGAFYLESRQAGVLFSGGFVNEMSFRFTNLWIDFTEANPIVTTITNVTPLVQYWENANAYMVIATEDDYKIVKKLISEWYASSRLTISALEETNRLLGLALEEGKPYPRPPIRRY